MSEQQMDRRTLLKTMAAAGIAGPFAAGVAPARAAAGTAAAQADVAPFTIEVGDEALGGVISHYTHEAGVRQLERELGRMVRKVARRLASPPEEPGDGADEAVEAVATTDVGAAGVRAFLGRPRGLPERALARAAVGVAAE